MPDLTADSRVREAASPAEGLTKGRGRMHEPVKQEYETRLNIQYGPLEVIDEKHLAETCRFR